MSADRTSASSDRGEFAECPDCEFDELREDWNGCPMCLNEVDESVFEGDDGANAVGAIILVILVVGGMWVFSKLQEAGFFVV
ncbi:hypothetical protein [Halopiger thermotolerans]